MLSSREEKELRGLRRRKVREREGRFVAEGVRVVEDLVKSSLPVHWIVSSSSLEDDERGRALVAEVDRQGIPRRVLSEAEFSRHADTESPQGVLAVAEIPRWELSHLHEPSTSSVLLILDAVQDPGNFGTMVRTAEALGAVGGICLPGTVDPWNPKAVRAAMGSSFRLPLVSANWEEASAWLRREEFTILATAAGGEPVSRSAGAKVALALGNEGAGVSELVLSSADRTVGIPLRGRAESLNVAAAAAILLYDLLR